MDQKTFDSCVLWETVCAWRHPHTIQRPKPSARCTFLKKKHQLLTLCRWYLGNDPQITISWIESSFLPTKNSLTEPRCGKKAKQYDGESCCSTRMRLPIPAHVSPTRWSSLTFHPQISSCGQDRQGNQNVQQMKIAEGHRHVLNAPGRGRLKPPESPLAERMRWVKTGIPPKWEGLMLKRDRKCWVPGFPTFSALFNTVNSDVWWLVSA